MEDPDRRHGGRPRIGAFDREEGVRDAIERKVEARDAHLKAEPRRVAPDGSEPPAPSIDRGRAREGAIEAAAAAEKSAGRVRTGGAAPQGAEEVTIRKPEAEQRRRRLRRAARGLAAAAAKADRELDEAMAEAASSRDDEAGVAESATGTGAKVHAAAAIDLGHRSRDRSELRHAEKPAVRDGGDGTADRGARGERRRARERVAAQDSRARTRRRIEAAGTADRLAAKAASAMAREGAVAGIEGRMKRQAAVAATGDTAHAGRLRSMRGVRNAAAYGRHAGRAQGPLHARLASWVVGVLSATARRALVGAWMWLPPALGAALLVASCTSVPILTDSQSEPKRGITWDVTHAYSVWFCQETNPWGRYHAGEAYDYSPWDTSGAVAMTMAIDIVTDSNMTPAQYFDARRNAGLWHSDTTDWSGRSDTGRQIADIKGHDGDPAYNQFHERFDVRTERISRSLDSIRAALSRGQVVVLGAANGAGTDPWLVNADKTGSPSYGKTAREPDQHEGYHTIVIWRYEKGHFLTKHSGAVGRVANNVPYTDDQMQALLDSCGTRYAWLADAVYAVGNTYTSYATAVGAQAQKVVDAAYAALNSASRYRLYGDPFANGTMISEIGYDSEGRLRLPDTDCGGLVNFCYTQAGVSGVHGLGTGWYDGKSLPAGLVEVPVDQMQPGDIMWWPGAHVGIYVGNDQSIEHRDSNHTYGGWVQLVDDAHARAPRALHYTAFGPGGSAVGAAAQVVQAARVTPSPGSGLCAMWVSQVFANAGFDYATGNACDMYWAYCHSEISAIRPGMIVAVATHPHTKAGRVWGHVAIYIGEGQVVDNVGYIRTMGLQEWADYYGNGAGGGQVRCGWLMDIDLSASSASGLPASAGWFVTDSWYVVAMQRKAELYGSTTDWLFCNDCDLCRVTLLHREGGSWLPAAGWNAVMGHKNGRTRSASIKGAWSVDHKTDVCTCYLPAFHRDGTDNCQRFEPSNYGDPDTMPLWMRWQSHGCCNIESVKARWIHDNIPIGTTVVVFDMVNPNPLWREWDYYG